MWGVLPVKNFENAKTRLAPALSPEERRALFRLMVEDVLAAMVLTNEPEVSDLAGRYGARAVGEPENLGQSQAVARAMRILESEDVRAAVQLPGDIPAISSAEINAIVAAHGEGRKKAMTIVQAHDFRGSNALAVSPPTLIRFHFGHDSFEPHLASALNL